MTANQPYELHDYQEEAVERILAEPTRAAIVADEVGLGKAQPLDALVLTPDGFKPMGEMTVGQEVITPTGGTALVDGVYPQGVRPVYELTLVDGRKVRADIDHIWVVNSDNRRHHGRPPVEKTTRELLGDLKKASGTAKWAIEQIEAADFGGEWSSNIDPYFLGLLLGDGCVTQHTAYISTADEEILQHIRSVLPNGVKATHTGGYDYRLAGENGTSRANPLTVELRRLGIMGKNAWNKSIPNELLNVPVASRLALLQGLLDSDGSPSMKTGAEFLSASVDLASQVAWLARSLGGRVSESVKRLNGKEYQRLRLRLPNELAPFRLTRKMAKMTPTTKYARIPLAIKSIDFVGEEETQCIHIDSPEHEYVTDGFVRTHNTIQTVELALRAGWKRALFIGIKDTFGQWRTTIERQSRGAVTIRLMESTTKDGRAAYADFLAGQPGFYFASIQWLNRQDFTYRDKTDAEGLPIPQIDKKTGLPTGKNERERKQLMTFRNMCNRKGSGLDAVVYDEAHQSSAHNSVTRKTLMTLHSGREDDPMWKIALSATWSGNSFENAWSLPQWCWPKHVHAYGFWRDDWCAMEDQYVPGKSKPVQKVVGEKNPGEWVRSLPCYIRRENEDRPPAPIKVYVNPTPRQAAQFADLERDLMTWVDTQAASGVVPLVVDVPGALHTRFKQLALAELTVSADGENVSFPPDAASSKLRALRGVLDAWGDQPVFIVTDSKLMANLTVQRMQAAGYSAVAYTGDTPKKDRVPIKEAFIRGDFQYLVGTVQACGTGLDGLQWVCSKMVWLSVPDGDPKLETQALGRVFRQGRTHKYGQFQHVQIVMRDWDEGILERLLAKGAAIQASVGAHNLVA